jgi:hypothetical protein
MSSTRNTVHESYRLACKEGDWNLAGACSNLTSRTRGGGSGRPNLSQRHVLESSLDSEYVQLQDTSSEEEFLVDVSSSSDSEDDPEEDERKPDPTCLVLKQESLKKCIEKNCRCPTCNGPVDVKFKTLCLASNIMLLCRDKDCGYIDVSEQPSTAEIGDRNEDDPSRNRMTDYAINVLYVLGFLSCGDGCTEAARLLGLLGLPNDTTMESRSFVIIEERISPIIQSVTNEILLENLTEEVRLTFEAMADKDASDFAMWKMAIAGGDNPLVLNTSKYPPISVSFDMGWQQRSSGHKYASPSGHAFFVGGLSRKPIAIYVKSKICNYCASYKRKHGPEVEVPVHKCTINHVGTSASMESQAALAMFLELYDVMLVRVARVCIDDDASTKATLRWSNADYMRNTKSNRPPQVPKQSGPNKGELHDRPDNGKLPAHIPEPVFVADPNHRKKVLTKDLNALAGAVVAVSHHMSKMDVTRLGKSYGYMIRNLKNLNEDQYLDAGKAVLEHHFDNHQYCGIWCPRKRMTNGQLHASDRYYRCKTKDAKLYAKLQDMIGRFTTMARLRECAHCMDTQVNESLNNTIAWLAPKNKCYGGSQSLRNRISMAVGISTLGFDKFFVRMFYALGIAMTPNIQHFLQVKEQKRSKRIAKTKTKDAKRGRRTGMYDKLRQQEKDKRKEKKNKAGTYKSGMNMDAEEVIHDSDDGGGKPPAKKKTKASADTVCKHCGITGHSRTTSKKCLKYKPPAARTQSETQQQQQQTQDDLMAEDDADDLDAYEAIPLDNLRRSSNSSDKESDDEGDRDPDIQVLHVI